MHLEYLRQGCQGKLTAVPALLLKL